MLLLLETKEAQLFHQLLLGMGSPAEAGPEVCTLGSSLLGSVSCASFGRVDADIPESMPCASPHLQVLVLVPVPEPVEIGLVPDINDHTVDHVVGLDVADQVGQVVVPAGPVTVITGVGGS
jgi:hypothetical protein